MSLFSRIPGPVIGSRSDPTTQIFNHGGIRMKLEDRAATGILTGDTVKQQRM